MKKYILCFLFFKICADVALSVPTFNSIQLIDAENKAGLKGGCDGTGRTVTIKEGGGLFGGGKTIQLKDRRADALLFLRTKKYIDALSDFVNVLRDKINDAVIQIDQLVADSTFRRTRILGLQKGIADTAHLINTMKTNIEGVFQPVATGLQTQTQTIASTLNVQPKTTQAQGTFLATMQNQLDQIQMIVQAMQDGAVIVNNTLMQLSKATNAGQQQMIGRRLEMQKRQLSNDQAAVQALQDMLNKLDTKILQQQIDTMRGYAQEIASAQSSISYHQDVFNADQKQIGVLKDTINNQYIPLLNQAKQAIDEKAQWLQSKAADKEMFANCRTFFERTLF